MTTTRACEIRSCMGISRCWTQKPLNTAVENRFEKCPQMRGERTRFAKLRKVDVMGRMEEI